jgi:Family of unknown function (DUF6088)
LKTNTESKILDKIRKVGRGSLVFGDHFIRIGNPRMALARLVKSGELAKVATGIYVRPEKDPIIGLITPGIEEIALAIAKRDKARIVPTGIYALNKLGLSSQVPLNIVYFTDGSARKIKAGNQTITFKRTTPKNLSAIGEISKLVIQALRSIGKENVTPEQVKKIQQLLQKEKKTHLQHDIRLAPAWIRQIMQPLK